MSMHQCKVERDEIIAQPRAADPHDYIPIFTMEKIDDDINC